ncbi:MAG: GNAT family N-acetyltransferase [Candidatus Bathyarchaeota archaeon]|nr:GNAT family N-acetyltransferase [Candidatus Bathyarchaeota archaeon]
MKLEIIDVKVNPLRDEEIKDIVNIERHPLVKKWLVEYADESFEKELEEYTRFFNSLRDNNRVDVLVAKIDGNIAGFLALWRMDDNEHVASIGVSTHPDYWGKGVATNLIKESIKLAKKKGIGKLIIETLEENSVMRHVAEKLGFKLEEIRKKKIFKDGDYHDEVVYSLKL